MRYVSVCSGIEAATVAWAPLGWEPGVFAEIEPFCCALLQHHYPGVPNVGDFTTLTAGAVHGPVDLCIAGPPCQTFSLAGQRAGLADPRGNLTLAYLALVDRLRPRWMVMENVPGLLSDDGGRTFGTLLGILGECGYGFAYRILDAQYFGVAQRRQRLFLVGYLGDWRPPAAVLFERASLRGDSPPRRDARQSPAASPGRGADSAGGDGESLWIVNGNSTPEVSDNLAYPLRANDGSGNRQVFAYSPSPAERAGKTGNRDACRNAVPIGTDSLQHSILAQNGSDIQINEIPGTVSASYARQTSGDLVFSTSGHSHWREGVGALPRRTGKDSQNRLVFAPTKARCLTSNYGKQLDNSDTSEPPTVIAFTERTRATGRRLEYQHDLAYCLTNPGSGGRPHSRLLHDPTTLIRRLTPRECERLQGFSDIERNVTILICQNYLDLQENHVRAAIQNLKSPVLAGNVVSNETQGNARSVERPLHLSALLGKRHAVVHVQLSYEARTLELHNAGTLLWSVSIADDKSKLRLPRQLANFVRVVVLMLATLERITSDGKVELPHRMISFTPPEHGKKYVLLSGREKKEYAKDAEASIRKAKDFLKSTTSEAMSSFRSYDLMLATLSSSVVRAISSYIPDSIKTANSYELSISTTQGYTLVPYRGQPATDAPRYRAIGNSFAVPVIRWIGQRIQHVEEILSCGVPVP